MTTVKLEYVTDVFSPPAHRSVIVRVNFFHCLSRGGAKLHNMTSLNHPVTSPIAIFEFGLPFNSRMMMTRKRGGVIFLTVGETDK